ncbi:hypothetical protein H5410_052672 [Solanum commersonii]|uniref:Uncharacterized protein n=1 Tax=Solanum commersonii TaxID=4109 RepID=A0A9J5X3P9_SOLCO|nr:hypothetical protein H5410_052672 [Solanum commersonii]
MIESTGGWWKCNIDGESRAGDLVGAKGIKIQGSTSIVAEAIAVKEGLQYCWEHDFVQVLLESSCSYALLRVQHSLREGNSLANYFANLVFQFNRFQDVSSAGKTIINADKYGRKISIDLAKKNRSIQRYTFNRACKDFFSPADAKLVVSIVGESLCPAGSSLRKRGQGKDDTKS